MAFRCARSCAVLLVVLVGCGGSAFSNDGPSGGAGEGGSGGIDAGGTGGSSSQSGGNAGAAGQSTGGAGDVGGSTGSGGVIPVFDAGTTLDAGDIVEADA